MKKRKLKAYAIVEYGKKQHEFPITGVDMLRLPNTMATAIFCELEIAKFTLTEHRLYMKRRGMKPYKVKIVPCTITYSEPK